jgi:hypothetical protein
LPVVQSVSAEQVVRHALTPQTYAPQLIVPGLVQVPLPEQNAAGVKVLPAQDAPPQGTVVAACWQAPAPSQAPVLPQVAPAVQRACGSAAPLPTLPHMPDPPQTWQVGQLATPQQKPSTQKPVAHSCAAAQEPLPFLGRQLPPAPVQ